VAPRLQAAARTASPSGWQTGGSECGTPAVAAASLTDLRLTAFDTAASLAIASGTCVKHAQRMLGHKDAAMTLSVYASLFEDDLDDVSNRVDAVSLEAGAPVCDLNPRPRRSSNCPNGPPE
jgi:hypothetical protein